MVVGLLSQSNNYGNFYLKMHGMYHIRFFSLVEVLLKIQVKGTLKTFDMFPY